MTRCSDTHIIQNLSKIHPSSLTPLDQLRRDKRSKIQEFPHVTLPVLPVPSLSRGANDSVSKGVPYLLCVSVFYSLYRISRN
jgi:hypothetical protein